MKTLLSGKNYHLFISRYIWAWFELWLEYDQYNYIASLTIGTFQIGFEWVWLKSRPNLKKNSKQIIWMRQG